MAPLSFQGSLSRVLPTVKDGTPQDTAEVALYIEKNGVRVAPRGGTSYTVSLTRVTRSWVEGTLGARSCCFEVDDAFGEPSMVYKFAAANSKEAETLREMLRSAAAAKASALEAALVEANRAHKRPVLVVDWKTRTRVRLGRRVEAAGFRVAYATTADEALQMWSGAPAGAFAAVVVEVLMPKATGWDFTRDVRSVEALRRERSGAEAAGPRLPILGVSAGRNGDESAEDPRAADGQILSSLVCHCEAAGMNAYCDGNASVRRIQWELCQLARDDCAAVDAPAPGAPAPMEKSTNALEDDDDEDIDEALAEWKRRHANQWLFRALIVPLIMARTFRRAFRRRAPMWMNAMLIAMFGEGAKG